VRRPSVPALLVSGCGTATVGALLAGMWLVYGLGYGLIAVAPVLAFLTWLASTLAPDEQTDKPSSSPPVSVNVQPAPLAAAPPVPPVRLTPKVRADA
jgi:hypothetical protein